MSRISHDSRHYSVDWDGWDDGSVVVVVAKVEEEIALICMAQW